MTEVDKILYQLGYFNSDPHKKSEIQDYIDEAVEYMIRAGVPESETTSKIAFAIKSIWADYRDKGENEKIIRKDGMIISLTSQIKR